MDFDERACFALYVHDFTCLLIPLGLPHHCNSQNLLEISSFLCSPHSLGSFGSLGQISLFFDPRPPESFYFGYLNSFWYVLSLIQSIGTKSANCIG